MALGIQDPDLERLLLTRRLRASATGWPLQSLVKLGAIGVLAVTPAPAIWPFPSSAWALGAIALGLAAGWLGRNAARHSAELPRLQAAALSIERLTLVEAVWWALALGIAAWMARGDTIGAVLAAGIAVLAAPLLHHRGFSPGARFRTVVLSIGLAAGTVLGAGSASPPYLLLILLLSSSIWIGLGARDSSLIREARRDVARKRDDAMIVRFIAEHESQGADWSWSADREGRLRDVSPRFAASLGETAAELDGAELASLFEVGRDRDALAAAVAEGHDFRELPVRIAADGEARTVMLTGNCSSPGHGLWRGTGRFAAFTAPVTDRVSRMARADPLTGLANRHALLTQLSAMMGRAEERDRPAALFVLDLDDFKSVNATQGPAFGDALLRDFATRLRTDARACDLVARLGGNRFALVMEALGGDSLLIGRAHRLLAVAREPFQLHEATIRLSTSVGLARMEPGISATELLRRAELALHSAKAKGRDRMALYEESLDRGARDRRLLEAELREAIAREELMIHYQPVIALATGETVAFEALVRWNHPTRGPLLPDRFLPVAEESGLILTLGAWVIRRALEDAARWDGSFRLAINLSPSQIRDPRLASTIEAALAITAFPASRLEFEITEHVLFDDAHRGRRTLERLRALGVQIALDDFGTGYSSLSYLRRFRFDRVKIDRVFVSDIEQSDEARAIVSTITRLAQALDIHTTAEGVEDPRQLDMLRKLGCDEAQGFLIHQPATAGAIAAAREAGEAFPDASTRLADYRASRKAAVGRPSPRSL